jgi:post-segregation antitoxin (ccd killing protein)
MKPTYDLSAKKRPVNLTLNEDLVIRVKGIADNLSGVVESLLADYVARDARERLAKSQAVQVAVEAWNVFGEENGSFADEHSTL